MFGDKLQEIKERGAGSLHWLRDKLTSGDPPFGVVDPTNGRGPVIQDALVEEPETDTVVVSKRVIARFFVKAAAYPANEVAGLLRGHIAGRYLHITGLTLHNDVGTRSHVSLDTADFARARDACDEQEMVIGWAHSHPGHGVFMSGVDIRHQVQGQDLDPDYAALVMDPFESEGIAYNFFRVDNGRATVLPHRYLEEHDGPRETDADLLVEPGDD